MRRVGKSALLCLLHAELESIGKTVCYIDKESLEFDEIKSYKDLYNYATAKLSKAGSSGVLLVDEIQEIDGWEKCIASFHKESQFDIVITGSNAHLLSSELATHITGRFIEIRVYPLSFIEFNGFLKLSKRKTTTSSVLQLYLKFGGLPGLHYLDLDDEIVFPYISAIFESILFKDVVKRYQVRNVRLLADLTNFVFAQAGHIFSVNKINDFLKSHKINSTVETIQNYLGFLESAFLIHKVPRYDLRGKRLLEFYEKYYANDIGMRNSVLGYKEEDISRLIENIVYLELRRRKYSVTIGKIDEYEIDFIAKKQSTTIYIQVCYLLASEETVSREIRPLNLIRNNHPKLLITLDEHFVGNFNGIKHIHLIKFLKGHWN
jgi:predicted AAA+ superfamily ATPase